ncbi:hypothetical protein [Nocardia otitidiscaviarum]|uniref:hypothetical protein n=1 Tax=Nocardia otitidiscaviarum TaxID=1823 RepID=UPI0004A7326C|nr:hypothetical protein [Nocardia otitidiscaviarum]
MKIVSKSELKKMPKGTPFVLYGGEGSRWPDGFDILVGDCGYIDDFYYRSINTPDARSSDEMLERERAMDTTGVSYPVDLNVDREGYYDPDTRYLVWEPDDVRRIVHLLLGGDNDEQDDRP